MNLIIFGPPGAGKGTQAQLISKKFNFYHLSAGDILRNESKKSSEMGKVIEKIISNGDMVTDEIINTLIKNVIINPLYKNRIIFDGYPRNLLQAENLEKILHQNKQKISAIFFLNVTRDVIEKRITGRLICEKCNMTFNEFLNKEEIKLHKCDKKYLIKRTDDYREAIITRYDTYMKKTKQVLNFYSSREYFNEINGSQKIEEISSKIEQIIDV